MADVRANKFNKSVNIVAFLQFVSSNPVKKLLESGLP